jgi:basic amino acid/polyamine antiporter, APA family
VIALVLVLYRTQTTWPGLAIVLSGVPAYLIWRKLGPRPAER